jgi:hypothetical protein
MSDVGFNDFHVSAALQYRCEKIIPFAQPIPFARLFI